MAPDAGLVRWLSRADLPPAFERWRLVLAPGARRLTSPSEWEGALVVVERGSVTVGCGGGGSRSFVTGDLLALGWLPVRSLGNVGAQDAWLLAVRRRDHPDRSCRTLAGMADTVRP